MRSSIPETTKRHCGKPDEQADLKTLRSTNQKVSMSNQQHTPGRGKFTVTKSAITNLVSSSHVAPNGVCMADEIPTRSQRQPDRRRAGTAGALERILMMGELEMDHLDGIANLIAKAKAVQLWGDVLNIPQAAHVGDYITGFEVMGLAESFVGTGRLDMVLRA